MTYDTRGALAPDYLPCRYGASRLLFRGPKRKLDGDYIAVFGSTETYGKFIDVPYPELLQKRLDMNVVNLGCQNAGVDAFGQDASLIEIANRSRAVVVQVMGAQNMSNRLYRVHPRRNDRFINAASLLKAVYREVDFTDFHFTRHMLNKLKSIDAHRFEMVREELRQAWMARMQALLAQINRPVFLLWFAEHYPPAPEESIERDPLFVDAEMLGAVTPAAAGTITAVASAAAIEEGTARMLFDPMDQAAAAEQLSVMAHEEAAERLAKAIAPILVSA